MSDATPLKQNNDDQDQVIVSDDEVKDNVNENGKCAFVTGGSGYLGRNLIDYLVSKGWRVMALARSERSAKTVKAHGGIPVQGDLDAVKEMTVGMEGCDVCFHCAAFVASWGHLDTIMQIQRVGTLNVIKACKDARVKRLIHVSTEQVLHQKNVAMSGVDESTPYPDPVFGVYGASKKVAEVTALDANDPDNGFEVMVVRPRWIWGKDDSTILPEIIEQTKAGLYKWMDGAEFKTSTCHVTNVCHGMLLCAEKGKGGEVYFLTDGVDSVSKEFVSDMLICSGTEPPTANVSYALMFCLTGCLECCCCCGKACACCGCCAPPFTQADLATVGRECTVKDTKIREELGYKEIVSMKEGMLGIAKKYGIDADSVQDRLYCCK